MPAFFEFAPGKIDYSTLRPGPLTAQVIKINRSLKTASAAKIAAIRKEVLSTPPSAIWDLAALQRSNEEVVAKLRANFERYGVFCTSTRKDNLLMWSHYCDHHRGAVIEISPSAEKDSALLVSKPVAYSAERPLMYRSPKQLIAQALAMAAELSARLASAASL